MVAAHEATALSHDAPARPQDNAFAPSDLLVLAASALFWAWFDSGVFRPTFLEPFDGAGHLFLPYLVCAVAAGGAVLLASCLRTGAPAQADEPARERRRWAVGSSLALGGAALSLAGGATSSLALVVLGAVGTGGSCGTFQIAWGSVYARAGSRFAGQTVALSIVLGVVVDALVMGLDARFAAAFTAALPLVSAALALFLFRETTQPPQETPVGRATSAEELFGSHRTLAGLPLSLLVAFGLFGLSFGYYQHSAVFLPANVAAYTSDALIAARGVTALVICLLLRFFPRRAYTIFKLGTLVGIAGFIAAPIFSLVETEGIAASAVIAVGYTTFDIATWALMAELVRTTGTPSARLIGCGRFVIHLGEAIAVAGCSALASLPAAREALASTVGYGCVVAEMLLLADNSALWLLMKADRSEARADASGAPIPDAVPSTGQMPGDIAQIAATHMLTERESEVLALLLAGHGRARVAQALGISENTLGTHIQQLYRKVGVHSRQELLDRFRG